MTSKFSRLVLSSFCRNFPALNKPNPTVSISTPWLIPLYDSSAESYSRKESRPVLEGSHLVPTNHNSYPQFRNQSFFSSGGNSFWPLVGLIASGIVPACLISTVATTAEAKEAPPITLEDKVTLYQYEACPFCNKVKAYLDYRDIPYKVVEVNPIGKKEIKFSSYKKVPVVVVGEQQLNDSSEIISGLEARLNPEKAYLVEENRAETEEDVWRKWVDGHLVHLLSPNIYKTPSEAIEAFDYITTNGNFSFSEKLAAKYVGATAMYFIARKLKKKYNIVNEREELYAAANDWVTALNGKDFLGGDKPNLADLAVFGVLRPIIELRTGRDLLQNSEIGVWYGRMVEAVGPSSRLA